VSYGAGNPNADNTVTYYGAEGVELNLSATGSISGFKGIRWIFKSASEGETVLKEGDATFDAGQLGKDAVYEKTIRVAADPGERLDGFLTFVLIDGAGNPSEEIAKGPHIVIDNAVPVVTPDYEGSFAMYADPQGTQTAASVEDAKLITYKETNRSFKLFINDPSFSLDRTPVVKKAYSTETVASEYVDISSEVVWTQDGNGGFVAEIPLGGDGSYSYTVECTDLADNTQTYTTPEIVVDTVNPAVSVVTKGETDGMAANSSYYRCPVLATVNVWVKQARVFDANKISISAFSALNAAGNNVNVEGIDKDSFDSDLKNAEWVRTGDAVSGYTFSTTLTLTEEAKYSFTVEAKTIENSGESGQFENYPYGTKKLTSTVIVDKTPPKVDEITYSNNFINKVLNVITFGYYNSDVTVTVEISDEISGIEKATVRYHKAENASTLNVGRKEEKYVLAQEEKGAPNYTCTITLNADDGSYDGFINVTAVDMAHNTTDKKNDAGEVETYTDTENRIVVDNIAPGLEVSRKGGKTVNKETLEEITNVVTDNDAILIFNRDKVSYTIKIDEINFSGDITNDNDSFQNEDINDHGNVKDPDGGRLDLGCELALYKVGEDENPFKTIDPFWTGTSKSVYKTTVNLLNGEVYQGEDDDNNGNYYLADG
ncbi:MAG: hypothetical protein IKQ18_04635, partial [Clostridia bacterium]|nr:hypothetical protein [Clostridia bacterium]